MTSTKFRRARGQSLLLVTAAALLPLGACQGAGPSATAVDAGDAVVVQPKDGHGATAGAGSTVAPAPAKPAVTTVDAGVPGDAMGVTVHKLSNGMTVMLSENHEEPRIEAWITTRAGGAKDPADATGMAHYLEHMQFKGTTRLGTLDWQKEKPHLDRIQQIYEELFHTTDADKRKALYAEIDRENQAASQYEVPNEFDRVYDQLGMQGTNAFTSNDQTSYTTNLPSNRVRQWAEVESERLREPVYRLFQTELEAVYEEKNRGMDSKERATFEALQSALFPQHPYGTQTVLGHVEHLKNPSLAKMYEYFRRWYVPGNMCVALSGDFNKAEVLDILESTLGKLESRAFPDDPKFPIAPPQGVKRVDVKHKGEEIVMLAFLTTPENHPDYPALVLCDMMLANGKTGLIDRNLNQSQKVRQAGCSPTGYLEAGFQLFNASPKPGQTLDELEHLILEQIELLKKGEFTADDLSAVMTNFEIEQKRELESNRSRVTQMTSTFIQRRPWADSVRFLDNLKKLGKSDVVAAANKYFGANYVVVTRHDGEPDIPKITKPGFTAVTIDASRHSPWFTEILTAKVPPIEPRFVEKGRDVEETALRSGKLVYSRNPLNDVFDLTFTVAFGTDHDPRLGMGLSLLDLAGAGEMDGVALKRRLYALGSTFSAGAGREETTISVSGLESNLEATVDLLRTHFAQPTGVGQADVEKMVQRTIASRKAQKNDPRGINAALGEFGRRGAESAFLRQPSDKELLSWQAEDLLAATKDVWKYRRTVTYVGQLPIDKVAAIVDLAPVGGAIDSIADAPARKPLVLVKPAKDRILLVDRKTSQSQVTIAAADGTFDRVQVPFQRVYNEYMGGSMSGVVFQEIRESRALAYEAGTAYRAPAWKEDENTMMGALGTQADKTLDALQVLLGIVRNLPSADSRFSAAITSIDQTYRTSRSGFRNTPNLWVTWQHQGLDGDPRPWNWSRVKEMSLPGLLEWTKRFEKMPFTITIVGPKEKIDMERLKTFGDVTEMTPNELFAW
ncbi:MAG: insulinase family protein [Planctomycetes bacterium]|nr:insulinase family protein [Planctomycetota bacterium]